MVVSGGEVTVVVTASQVQVDSAFLTTSSMSVAAYSMGDVSHGIDANSMMRKWYKTTMHGDAQS